MFAELDAAVWKGFQTGKQRDRAYNNGLSRNYACMDAALGVVLARSSSLYSGESYLTIEIICIGFEANGRWGVSNLQMRTILKNKAGLITRRNYSIHLLTG